MIKEKPMIKHNLCRPQAAAAIRPLLTPVIAV
jgi:hypothetical protein